MGKKKKKNPFFEEPRSTLNYDVTIFRVFPLEEMLIVYGLSFWPLTT
jgi:hypothetical protein